ncbi:hypothetical protein J4433_00235 [Candidatus Pacearchaeota archaeon]|nr:hypothetical protein [Candidatus Pacearchaeota archaeon]
MKDNLESGLETESECGLEFDVPINAYNVAEALEKDIKRKKAKYFTGLPFRITGYNVSLNTLGIHCRKQDEAKLKEILTKYFSMLKET